MNLTELELLFLLFIIYSFLGWILETITCSIENKKLVNRGFLIGPIIPIYGFGSILMILLLKKYYDDPLALFIMAIIICSILEYSVSLLMEKMYNTRWWDYSNRRFNINGRVCLSNAICFGGLGILLLYYINPFLTKILYNVPSFWLNLSSLLIIFILLYDLILSLIIVKEFTKTAKLVKKDSSDEINTKIYDLLHERSLSFLYARLIKAFPNYKVKLKEFKERIKNSNKNS